MREHRKSNPANPGSASQALVIPKLNPAGLVAGLGILGGVTNPAGETRLWLLAGHSEQDRGRRPRIAIVRPNWRPRRTARFYSSGVLSSARCDDWRIQDDSRSKTGSGNPRCFRVTDDSAEGGR